METKNVAQKNVDDHHLCVEKPIHINRNSTMIEIQCTSSYGKYSTDSEKNYRSQHVLKSKSSVKS